MGRLLKRKVNSAMLAAYRANGAKAHGAVTGRGKSIVRYNAAKHWGRAETMRVLLPALDEHAEDFNRLRKGLYDSLQPRDAFETLLVDDMADIHWRLRRMIRGEAGIMAKQRREEKARLEQLEAAKESGRLNDLEPSVIAVLGFVGLNDSAPKFTRILERLNLVGFQVQQEGFDEGGLNLLKQVYGHNPGLRGRNVIDAYEYGLEAKKSGDAERDKQCQAALNKGLHEEVDWFKQRAASERQARDELRAPRTEAAMLEGKFDPAKSTLYQERLERRFERKWKLFVRYQARRRALEEESVEAQAIEVEDAIEVETEDGNQLAEAAAGG